MFSIISHCCLLLFFVIELVLCSLSLILFFDLDPSFLLLLLFCVPDGVVWSCSLAFIVVVVVLCFCFCFLNLHFFIVLILLFVCVLVLCPLFWCSLCLFLVLVFVFRSVIVFCGFLMFVRCS